MMKISIATLGCILFVMLRGLSNAGVIDSVVNGAKQTYIQYEVSGNVGAMDVLNNPGDYSFEEVQSAIDLYGNISNKYGIEFNASVYSSDDGRGGYYLSEDIGNGNSIIGINMNSGNNETLSGVGMYNNLGHELSHAINKDAVGNSNEVYANYMGDSSVSNANFFNFFNGSSTSNNNSSISDWNNNNANSTLLQNNTLFAQQHQNNTVDKTLLFSRPISGTTWMPYTPNHNGLITTGSLSEISLHINFINENTNSSRTPSLIIPLPITNSMKEELNKQGVLLGVNDTNYIIMGGYKWQQVDENRQDLLLSSYNDTSDKNFIDANNYQIIEIMFNSSLNNKSQFEKDREVINVFNNYNNNAKYPFLGTPIVISNSIINSNINKINIANVIINKPANPSNLLPYLNINVFKDYNSNSLAATVCSNAGGTNCNYDFAGSVSPGDTQIIPDNYFDSSK